MWGRPALFVHMSETQFGLLIFQLLDISMTSALWLIKLNLHYIENCLTMINSREHARYGSCLLLTARYYDDGRKLFPSASTE